MYIQILNLLCILHTIKGEHMLDVVGTDTDIIIIKCVYVTPSHSGKVCAYCIRADLPCVSSVYIWSNNIYIQLMKFPPTPAPILFS